MVEDSTDCRKVDSSLVGKDHMAMDSNLALDSKSVLGNKDHTAMDSNLEGSKDRTFSEN